VTECDPTSGAQFNTAVPPALTGSVPITVPLSVKVTVPVAVAPEALELGAGVAVSSSCVPYVVLAPLVAATEPSSFSAVSVTLLALCATVIVCGVEELGADVPLPP
jgi:threonine/homoserine efflux transporter RhtA